MHQRLPHLVSFSLLASLLATQLPAQDAPRTKVAVREQWLDLDADASRQVTVRQVVGKYLGHPTTVTLGNGDLLCVHPEGHGKGAIVLQRSRDGGRSWSEPLPVPENWATSLETPTIHRLVAGDGKARLVLFSGLHPIRSSVSLDEGATWTPLAPIGDFGGIVAMASVVPLASGRHAAFFHDDGRYFQAEGKRSQFTVYQCESGDGGVTWAAPKVVWTGRELDLCEPGVVRSPDGKRLAMLLRENQRRKGSHLLLSDDEAATWSAPRELPPGLCGDRHVGAYGPDGRLLISFRDMAPESPTRGDWVAWVGRFDDVVAGRAGLYRVRLSRNWKGTDCGYPGVEVLADGTFVVTTYGHFAPSQPPFVRSVRLQLAELDALATGAAPSFARLPDTVVPAPRHQDAWQQRVAAQLATARAGGHRIVFVGDSITQSWDGGGKACWDEFWSPRQVINLGVSGDRTQHVLWRFDHDLMAALAAPNNDIRGAVVMIGTNTSNGSDNTADEIAQGIVAVVQRLRAGLPRAKVLLLAIFPRSETADAQREKCAAASRQAFAALANDPMVVCKDIGACFLAADGTLQKAVMPDFLHLSPAAYRTWTDAIVADVDAMLR
jgi:lysophospholipase L1-like esterase